ncbi:TetR family transcriptional regulator [Knoellia remsis]|uniref:TetR family transcriptional regulator n=1 Tax=Knoellia remsis TaxID=407159 RepID=A0A2T0U874_9MICO|nr:TetR family transcriptional regulator C-terminal domain-containing protein [Knoellia remsis]PRY54125.1 TetR family transcriptional regulator [Knoellia remsis]
MPKVVDHDARRAELGAAVRRVVADHGVAGATVRAVAAEAGWSVGALRYYFTSQDELLDFAVNDMVAGVPARIQDVLDTMEPGLDRAMALLVQLLPLDSDRIAEVRVYLAFMARERTRDGRPELAEAVWHGERHICALALADVRGGPYPRQIGAVPKALRDDVDELQVFVDGLSFLGATLPEKLTPARARTLLRARLSALAHEPS